MKHCVSNSRKKAFIGAAIGAATSIVGGLIGRRKQRKAQERAFRQAQEEQTKNEGFQQAAALSAQYVNQDYVNEYRNKITLKNGGKVSMKHKNNDRVSVAKKFKCGGRKKSSFGSQLINNIKDNAANGLMNETISGAGNIINAIANKPIQQKQIKTANGFAYGIPKVNMETNDYRIDDNGNPMNATNVNNVATTEYSDRLKQARFGTNRKRKC